MPITIKNLKSRPVSKVRFKLESIDSGDAAQVYLVGSFNDWCESANPMKKAKDGSFSLEVELPQGEEVIFRYFTSDGRWLNEKEAHEYRYCEFAAGDNSVLKL